MPLTTRCNRCGRLFPVYAQQLKSRRGRVSCPQCGARFDGVSALLDEPMPGFELSSGRVWTAARVGIGGGRATGTPSAVGLRLGIGGGSRPAAVSVAAPARPKPATGWAGRRPLARLGWLLGCLALVLALGAQWVWWQRDAWLKDPNGRLALGMLCERLGCALPVPRLPGALTVLGPTLTPDPAGGDTLTLRLSIRNDAPVPQPVPLLELDLLDREGELAANRRFEPREYAPAALAPLDPGETRTVSLAIAKSGLATSGFKVRLL